MDLEILYVNGHPCPHWVVPIPGDGSCLFHSLSFSMYKKIESLYEIRLTIVEYVVVHWNKLQLYACDERGDPYINADLYRTTMVKTTTYGSASELIAATALYPYAFEVYDNDLLRGSFDGDSGNPVKRLRFSGSFLGGHNEVLLQEIPPNDENSNKNYENLAKKGGRPKTSALSRSQQIKEAAARYRQNNSEKQDNIHHIIDQLESQVDNVAEENDGLLTQVTSEKEADYEQYTIYPLHERRRNTLISELYEMLKVNAAPIDSRDKDLDAKCFPDLYVEGKYGQFYVRQSAEASFISSVTMNRPDVWRQSKMIVFNEVVQRICAEADKTAAAKSLNNIPVLESSKKRNPRTKPVTDLDDFDKSVVSQTVEKFYVRSENPTVEK
ncbi:hypothetical protein HNY73_018460 [Argiope bruennichi]|uniref:OTU domain-containing protein n=1 Tax=Argiope bruennichi TaxID=94029 RepID=A0A8T0ED98_ARGBR|nr:hypothetical protein HNY73_018460 [Argiope bruennichi]